MSSSINTPNMRATRRYVAAVEYDGSHFCGWQRLSFALPSVQEAVEKSLSRVANQEVRVYCAGRTDRGVHAVNQIIHFDTQAQRLEHNWLLGTNTYLPPHIALRWVKDVGDEFHARYSALCRRYLYIIHNTPNRSALNPQGVTCYRYPLEVESMQKGALHLLGEHDFTSFRAKQCQARHAIREIISLQVRRVRSLLVIEIVANAFLHHMVRNITGVLCDVGRGKRDAEWVRELLLSKDRSKASPTAPPHGLYLASVGYDDSWGLPEQSSYPWFLQTLEERA